jgi:predicted signal transduction protein with EAL and GGDEF domain
VKVSCCGFDNGTLTSSGMTAMKLLPVTTWRPCRLVAEGVESEGEAKTLAGLGVEFAQGNWSGRPEPARRGPRTVN